MVKKYFYAETADVFSGIIARNKAVFDYEKFIHRTFYPYIIHPYSRFRVYWEIFILLLSPVKLTAYFSIWAFLEHSSFAYLFTTTCIQVLHLVDVILTFFSGYVEPYTEIVVLDPKKIARRYLLRNFVLDLFSCIPVELFMYFYDEECIAVRALTIYKDCQLVMFFTATCFFCRIWTFSRYLKNVAKILYWNPFLPSLISINYFFFFLVSFSFAFLFVYEKYIEHIILPKIWSWTDIFIFFHFLINFAFDLIFLNNTFFNAYTVLQIPVLVLSFFFGIFYSVYFIKYTIAKMKAKEGFFFLESRVKNFIKKKNLPFSLRRKTMLYFQILIKNKYHKEKEIFNYIPDTFKADIFFHFCLPLLTSFQAFEDLPTYVLRRLAESLEYQLYLPNDLVISKKEPKMSMYFIQRGTIALYSAQYVELYHFEAGSSISGRYFIEGKTLTNHFAISIEVTEVYRLDYENFIGIMRSYPKLLAQMKEKFYLAKNTSPDFFGSVFDS